MPDSSAAPSIGSIVCTPPDPMPGDSVLITVKPATGEAFDAATAARISINGAPGASRYVQFTRPGKNLITVKALGEAGATFSTATVDVQPVAAAAAGAGVAHQWAGIGVPLLQMAHLAQQPHQVGFAVGQSSQLMLRGGTGNLRARSLQRLPVLQIVRPGQTALYEWDFGDGARMSTMSPVAHHDFSPRLDPLREFQQFDVSVTSAGRTVTHSLTIYNLYAVLKRRFGLLHPPADANSFARRQGANWIGQMTVTNPEAQAITLTERRLVPIHADASQLAAALPVERLATPIVIGAKARLTLPVTATTAHVPANSQGFSVYLGGQAADGTKLRVNVHFDLDPKERPHTRGASQLFNPTETAALLKAVEAAVHPGAGGITLSQLRESDSAALAGFEAARPTLSNIHHVAALGASPGLASHPIATTLANNSGIRLKPPGVPHPAPQGSPAGPPPPPAAPQVGTECDPDNLPDHVPAGFVCQATAEQRLVTTPGRFMNARKGDAVLAPGGNGLIGGLLTHVGYPQRYSHSGIMTNNYSQITHCTASEDRMQAFPVGSIPLDGPEPVDGFRPDVVKYGWPGAITQTVENAVHGEPMKDPETGTPYNMQGFDGSADGATIAGSWQIIPPMVVKPDPMLETDALRLQLHKVADDAVAHTGKFHYRFYGYTDPTIGRSTTAPADAGWAKGTSPGVCSAFIWLMMKRNGMHLQGAGETVQPGDLSVAEVQGGAKIGPATPDGLYLYSAAERLAAANWLHDQIYNQAKDRIDQKAGIFGGLLEALTKMADHISDEFLNAFARDIVQTDDDDTGWQNTVDANAVSPDNIMMWNGPTAPTPGPFGYAEPLIYREPRYDTITVSKWREVQLTGALSGRVTFEGKPVEGATVTLYDGKSAGTDANGHYALQNVPYGPYQAKVQKVQPGGTFLSAEKNVTVGAANVTADISLALPPEEFRTVKIDGSIHTHYTYHIIVKTEDHSGDFPFHKEIDIGPYGTHADIGFDGNVDDAHAHLQVVLDWQLDKSVHVSFNFTLHDATYSNQFVLAKDTTQNWHAECSAKNDDAQMHFTITNALKQG